MVRDKKDYIQEGLNASHTPTHGYLKLDCDRTVSISSECGITVALGELLWTVTILGGKGMLVVLGRGGRFTLILLQVFNQFVDGFLNSGDCSVPDVKIKISRIS